jgi:hypothetical protein
MHVGQSTRIWPAGADLFIWPLLHSLSKGGCTSIFRIHVHNCFCIASSMPLTEHNNQSAPSRAKVLLDENFLKAPGVLGERS